MEDKPITLQPEKDQITNKEVVEKYFKPKEDKPITLDEAAENKRIIITEDSLFENGYILKGLYYFVHPVTNVVVKSVTTKTGKHFFSNNSRGVKYLDQLFQPTEGLKIKIPDKYLFLKVPNLKIKALKGDALICFFSRELICRSTDVFSKEEEIQIASKLVSNKYLEEVCMSIGLTPTSGTVYEANIYDIYLAHGFDKAFEYFKETVFDYYLKNGI